MTAVQPPIDARLTDRRRLAAVAATGLADRPAPSALRRLARIAANALDTSLSVAWLVTGDRQFKLGAGGPLADAAPAELFVADGFCRYVIESDGPLVIDDVLAHPLSEANPRLRQHGVNAYAGVPLRDDEGHAVGTLCVMNREARAFSREDLEMLEDLAGAAASEISLNAIRTLRVGRDGGPAIVLDRLTGVADRETLEWRLDAMLARRESTAPLALVCLDIDDFRLVNESFGRSAGDVTLRELARRLSMLAGADGIVGRVAGDRFVLVDGSPISTDPESMRMLADEIRLEVTRPYRVNGVEFRLEVNVGASAWPDPATDAAGLLEQGEQALRRAKRDSTSPIEVYRAPAADARDRLTLTARLSRAMQRGELELHYQPIISLQGPKEFASFEALLRWRSPERGLVPPPAFIPVAEQSDLIHELGGWVIDEACRQLRAWEDRGYRPTVAVNLSARQLETGDLAGRLATALDRHQVARDRLFLELTESAVTRDCERIEQLLAVLTQLGTPVSIDDFGTGESSLTRLRDLPFVALKLDRTFLSHLPGTPADRDVVEAVLRLADALGMVSVAEGVEHEAQHEFLVAHGCTYAQGFLYARPMPAADAERLLRAGGIHAGLRA